MCSSDLQKRKRVCPHCGRKLWMREFYPLKNGGRSSWCHECVLVYKREQYRKHRKVADGTFMHRTLGRLVEHKGYSTRIFWNGNMLSIMRRHYHNTLNRELAEMLGVSERSVTRKAREMGLEKDVLYAFRDASFIGEDTLIIVEASLNTDFDWAEDAGYEILKKKIYKTNVHVFLTPKSKHEGVKES